jgi:uncharacterized protein (DUF427 family)
MNQVIERQASGETAGHRLLFESSPKRVQAIVDGKTLADTVCAGLMLETGHQPVYYFPPQDVRAELLRPSQRRTIFPFQGTASYWSIESGGRRIDDAVWAYLDPLPECSRIRGYFCFYPEKLGIEVEGERSGA